MSKFDIRPQIESQKGFRMSKWDVRPEIECHNRAGRDDVTTGKLFSSRGECLGLYRCVLIIFKRK